MDDSFTRSLYIGRGKAQEVARRRETVEKELQAKRVLKIREQNERISRAAQQKEAELNKKMRQHHEKELQKQKAVLDRRCAQWEKNTAKKNDILQKAHNAASRSAQTQQKKNIYVFGSSTPRALSYLGGPKFYIRQDITSPSTSPCNELVSNRQSMTRTPSRIIAPQLSTLKSRNRDSHSSAVMTRSVFGRLNSNLNIPSKPRSAFSSRNTSVSGASSIGNAATMSLGVTAAKRKTLTTKRITPSMMTQSLYEPKALKTFPRKADKPFLANKAQLPNLSTTSTTKKITTPQSSTSTRPLKPPAAPITVIQKNESNHPLPIRPRKAVILKEKHTWASQNAFSDISQTESSANEASFLSLDNENPNELKGNNDSAINDITARIAAISLDSTITGTLMVSENVKINTNHCNATVPSTTTMKNEIAVFCQKKSSSTDQIFNSFDVIESKDSSGVDSCSTENKTNIESSNHSSIGNLLVATKEEWDSGHESNPALDADSTAILPNKEENGDFLTPKALSIEETDKSVVFNSFPLSSPNSSDNQFLNSSDLFQVNNGQKKVITSTTGTSTPVLPFVAATLEAAEKERECRRQKLNEILQRTRNANNGNSTLGISSTVTSPAELPPSDLATAKFQKLSGIDASALAQDLLAQRRQKLQSGGITLSSSLSTSAKNSDVDVGDTNLEKPAVNLNNELASPVFFNSGFQSSIVLTTAAITTTDFSSSYSIAKNSSQSDKFFRNNSLVQLPGEVFMKNVQSEQLQQPAIYTNGGNIDGIDTARRPTDNNNKHFNGADACIQESTINTSMLNECDNEESDVGIDFMLSPKLYQLNFVDYLS